MLAVNFIYKPQCPSLSFRQQLSYLQHSDIKRSRHHPQDTLRGAGYTRLTNPLQHPPLLDPPNPRPAPGITPYGDMTKQQYCPVKMQRRARTPSYCTQREREDRRRATLQIVWCCAACFEPHNHYSSRTHSGCEFDGSLGVSLSSPTISSDSHKPKWLPLQSPGLQE